MSMYSDKISVFESFKSKPKTITLGQWLKVCKEGSQYSKQVLEYRRTRNSFLKTSLPLATVGALCRDGRKMENVVTRTGWIALDIDAKDNPGLPDAPQIRDQIARIKNVAFSSLSASGQGVWALIKVSKTDRLAEHFRALQADFHKLGIKLDSSKGRNPNDARFYSYDPDAIIKTSFKIYTKQLFIKEPNPYRIISGHATKYAETAFNNEIQNLADTFEGNRNNQLFKASAKLSSLVYAKILNETDVRIALQNVAKSIGMKDYEIKATIESGFKHGFKNSRIKHISLT